MGDTVQRLRDCLERYRHRRACRAGWVRRFVPTRLRPLDEALPHGGLPCGAITEILAEGQGAGSMTLALRIARQGLAEASQGPSDETPARADESRCSSTCSGYVSSERALIILDATGDFYPPAMIPFGIDPQRATVLRTSDRRDAFWAVDQSLRCSGVGVVIASLPGLDEAQSRRLQLAAETSGSIGLLLGTARARGKSFAAVRIALDPVALSLQHGLAAQDRTTPDISTFRRFDVSTFCRFDPGAPGFRRFGVLLRGFVARLSLLSVREGMPSGPFLVDLHHATGACDLHSLPVHRSAVRTA